MWTDDAPAWIIDVPASTYPRARVAARAGLQSAFAFPVRGAARLAVIEFFAAERRDVDDDLLGTMTSLGTQIGQFVERCRADARRRAILNAAFDCVVTMDHHGNIVEVNEAAERTFGYTAAEMVGQELAALMVPPRLREPHRRGLQRYVETGQSKMINHPVEIEAMRKDGSEFPVELAITRPDLPGPPLFCGYIRDVTERRKRDAALRRLADEQAALRRVATAVAAEPEPSSVFGLVTEEVGRLLGAQSANMVRFAGDGRLTVVGGWNEAGVLSVPVGDTMQLDGDTVAARVWRTGLPARVDSYANVAGKVAERLRGLGLPRRRGRTGHARQRRVGRRDRLDRQAGAVPARRRAAPRRLRGAGGSGARQRADSREQLAASRARIVEAGDSERRRLERNLHDGAQQRLVALSLNLRLAARACRDDPEALDAFDRAGEELAQALEELRELARGIHPAVLSDRGLEPAIEALVARTPLPVQIDVGLAERLPEPVEAAAYYVVAEAVTNAAKHAQAEEVRVRIARSNGMACIEVADDGVGGAGTASGSGLRGLADRVEALGGRLRIESPAGEGTTVLAEIPAE